MVAGNSQDFTISRSIALNLTDRGAIVVIEGSSLGAIFRIRDDQEIVLGRNPMQCDLVIAGERISRKHCSVMFRSENQCYQIIDFSSNGSFLQDHTRLKKGQPYELPSGTEILLGDTKNIIKLG